MRLDQPSSRTKVRTAIRNAAAGVLDEPWVPFSTTTGAVLTSQTVFGLLVGLAAGDIVVGVATRVTSAASGSVPTTARVGLADVNGVMLAVSGNVNAAAGWALGGAQFAFSAPYTITSDGGYYVCMFVNGIWGTNSAQVPNQANAPTSGALGAMPGAAPISFSWAGQTDLPAVGNSLTLTSNGPLRYMVPYGTAVS